MIRDFTAPFKRLRAALRRQPLCPPAPRAPFVAAFLVKLHEDKRYMSDLRTFLLEHPALVSWLGFARLQCRARPHPCGHGRGCPGA